MKPLREGMVWALLLAGTVGVIYLVYRPLPSSPDRVIEVRSPTRVPAWPVIRTKQIAQAKEVMARATFLYERKNANDGNLFEALELLKQICDMLARTQADPSLEMKALQLKRTVETDHQEALHILKREYRRAQGIGDAQAMQKAYRRYRLMMGK